MLMQMLMNSNNLNTINNNSNLDWFNNSKKAFDLLKFNSNGSNNLNSNQIQIPDFKFMSSEYFKNNLPVSNNPAVMKENVLNTNNLMYNANKDNNPGKTDDKNKPVTTDVSDQLKNEIKELKKLTEEATKVIKPQNEKENFIENKNLKQEIIEHKISIKDNINDNKSSQNISQMGIIPIMNPEIEENQFKSEFEDKFEYLLDKLNIIGQIISNK